MARVKAPEQIIYDSVFKISNLLGYDTFSYLPPEGESYPFIFVGETTVTDRLTKSSLFGDVVQTVHVYHTYKKRFDANTMLNQIKREAYLLKEAENIHLRLRRGDIQFLLEESSPEHLLHGILDLEFTFNY